MDLAIVVRLLTLIGLFALMLSMGFKVTFAEVSTGLRSPRLVVAGLTANFVLVPVVAVVLLFLFEAEPMVSAGFLILAAFPGAPVGPPFTAIAKGNLSYATSQMVILAGFSTLIAPALLSILFTRLLPASELRIDFLAIIGTLLIFQLLPLAIGLGIHHRAPNLTRRVVRPVSAFANLLLLGVVALLLVREYATLQEIGQRGWIGMLVLLAASLGIGWLAGGPARATRKALSLTTAARNAAAGLVIVSSSFPGTPAVTTVVAYGLVSMLGTLACAWAFRARYFGTD